MLPSVAHSVVIEKSDVIPHATRNRFWFGAAATLLAMVVVAFAPTFYLRAAFDGPPLPMYLWIHGAALTAWFVLLAAQTTVTALGRATLHRQFGIAGVALATIVIATGAITTLRFVPRLSSLGIDVDAALPQLSAIVWGDFGLLAAFAVLFATAIIVRRKPHAHKRLVLLASINLTPPALARIAPWLGFDGIDQVVFALGGLLLLLLVLVAHDLASIRRIHPATLFGASVVLSLAVGALAAGGSEFARSIVRGLI